MPKRKRSKHINSGEHIFPPMVSSRAFDVEKILDKRTGRGGRTEYLLKWKNFPECASTWEPEDHLVIQEPIDKHLIQPTEYEKLVAATPASSSVKAGKSRNREQMNPRGVRKMWCCQ